MFPGGELMKALVLVDNIPDKGLEGEWGLSVLIEYGEKKILLDTGSSSLFIKNASLLGADLSAVDAAVLSHAHYDHANGMEAFFGVNENAAFYVREGTAENCYSKPGFFSRKYIGVPRGVMEKYRNRIRMVSGSCEAEKGMWLIPHHTEGLEKYGKKNKLYVRSGFRLVPDSFSHEQSLVFESDGELVVFSSCSHAGPDTVIREVRETFPGKKIRALAGGFHLFNYSDDEVRALAGRMRNLGISKIYTGHCTGDRAYEILREESGGAVQQFRCGLEMEL